jgi:Acetyltransferase (GNAT) family
MRTSPPANCEGPSPRLSKRQRDPGGICRPGARGSCGLAHRGAGVARELLEALEKRARERGLDAVRLDTHERLTEANGLYRSMGYREIDDYNGNPSANRRFEKVLA